MKKLTLILTVLLLICGISDAVVLTQKLGKNEIKTQIIQGQEVELHFNSKLGYQFTHWSVEEGTLDIPTDSESVTFIMPNQHIAIRWDYDSEYIIMYYPNEGKGWDKKQTVVAGASTNLIKNEFERDYYTFIGWAESETGDVEYQDVEGIKPTRNIDLYAQWDPNEYEVTLDQQNGIDGTTNVTATYTKPMPPITKPSRIGYTFGGYYSRKNGEGKQYYTKEGNSACNSDITKATTLYAYWTPNSYLVTFDKQNGSGGANNVTATYDVAMPEIETPSRTGYTFEGYYTGTGGSGTQYYKADGGSARNWDIAANTTLYAYWIPDTYTITVSAGAGGSVSPGTVTVKSGESKTFTITSNSGYAISSVILDGENIGVVSPVEFSNISGNHTIHVNFTAISPSSFGGSGGEQIYTVPATGIYFLEVAGAGGIGDNLGGTGGYSCGYTLLYAGERLYVNVGVTGGYNGAGTGEMAGGGATHIAKVSGTLANIGPANLSNILIIAGGGGGGATKTESYGYVRYYNGGDGGGYSGTAGSRDGGYSEGSGATQSGGYAFGQGGSAGGWGGGGGGGLYGGLAGGGAAGGGGGSGYIGGVPAFTYNGVTYEPSMSTGKGATFQNNGSAKISFVTSVASDFKLIGPTSLVYTGGTQTYTAPETGLYKIEAYGAGGGNYFEQATTAPGGSGGYSVGYVQLNKGQQLYVTIGGSGSGSRYNGGGSPRGGGATHVSKNVSGTLSSLGSGNLSNILLIAGGGGGAILNVENSGVSIYTWAGGSGGGSSGTAGQARANSTGGSAGTQNSGYAFGVGESAGSGGGGGLYGGTGGSGIAAAGGGGSGYIGVPAVTYNGKTYSPSMSTGGGSPSNADGKVVITFIK